MISPKVLKGSFVYYESGAEQGKVITFQYNPEAIQRIISPGDQRTRLHETISFTLALDASDGLEHADPIAVAVGIYPALSALELLVQPAGNAGGFLAGLWSRTTRRSDSLTVLVWGDRRILPVRVVRLVIREQMFDAKLNPIRASVDVELETLTGADLRNNPRAGTLMDAYVAGVGALAQEGPSGGSAEHLISV